MNRTAPTISPVNLNNSANSAFFRLGKMQLLVVAGIICGSMVASYYLGLITGRRTGYDTAMMARMNEMVRIPTDPNDVDAIELENREPIFAKLTKRDEENFGDLEQNNRIISGKTVQESANLPELQPIREFEAAAPSDLIPGDSEVDIAEINDSKETLLSGRVLEQGSTIARVIKDDGETVGEKIASMKVASVDIGKTSPQKELNIKEVKKEIKSSSTTPYVVQVAAPRYSKEAEDIVAKLKKNGYKNVSIERADVKGQSYYRVLVSGGKSKDEADRVASSIKKAKIVRGEPFVRHIGG